MTFWEIKTLQEMTPEEWESVCDRCGKCCLVKLEDEDTGEIAMTSVACKLIDLKTCLCTNYSQRCSLVPECIDLKQHDFSEYQWLPDTCAYRLLSNGQPLPDWHPLKSGSAQSVHQSGMSIRSYAIHESPQVDPEDHIMEWRS
ncbi:YcgN family cysteine cluster protein [Methylomonas methanica]|uniref:UPF0260 protein Metme_3145 n=1 Tax=Methylomonas methanica (strain DSM 25384 / MC09) TaxID=857087 RepID=G0A3P8_METMM|nr:YcgN family cysteine cluster protein [Methylomonas methanica]AEG01520.1 UPF0260 protein ycgN [Methylomonas methanica MC09]